MHCFNVKFIKKCILEHPFEMLMHCLILNGYISGTFNTITLHTPIRGKKKVSSLFRILKSLDRNDPFINIFCQFDIEFILLESLYVISNL